MLKTIGVSPKAWMPAIAGLSVGVALLVVGYLSKDAVLEGVGWAIVAAGLGHFGIAVAAPPGLVVSRSVEQAAGEFFSAPSVTSGEHTAVTATTDVVENDTKIGSNVAAPAPPAPVQPPPPAPPAA